MNRTVTEYHIEWLYTKRNVKCIVESNGALYIGREIDDDKISMTVDTIIKNVIVTSMN